jgi:hypothetical protein
MRQIAPAGITEKPNQDWACQCTAEWGIVGSDPLPTEYRAFRWSGGGTPEVGQVEWKRIRGARPERLFSTIMFAAA